MSDAPAVIDDTEGFGLEGVVDEADDADKDVDMEGEEEAEEVSQRDEEEQANCDEEPAEADDGPADPDTEIDGKKTRNKILMLPRLKTNKKTRMKMTWTKEKTMKIRHWTVTLKTRRLNYNLHIEPNYSMCSLLLSSSLPY